LQIHKEFVAIMAKRVMEYEKRFKEFINALCKSGLAEEVYLIGSRARGSSMPSSDFDIAIIVSDYGDPIEIAVKARLLRKEAFPLDIVVLRRSEAEDPTCREMFRDAKKMC
jgi:predicted nucleotidyltransferase